MEFFDLILYEVISNTTYGIQIKTKSSRNEFVEYVEEFNLKYSDEFEKFIYIVHTPDKSLVEFENTTENVELWKTDKLAKYVLELGLMDWILEKIK
jgi:hypothetical protein